jgi:hypothetical protein
MYGPVPLCRWMQRFIVRLREEQGKPPLPRGRSAYFALPVEMVILCLGELSMETGLINPAALRTGGEQEALVKEMLCQVSMMIKLVAAGSSQGEDEDGGSLLSLEDLLVVLEDQWLKSVPATGIR